MDQRRVVAQWEDDDQHDGCQRDCDTGRTIDETAKVAKVTIDRSASVSIDGLLCSIEPR
jgi:hypothetical protein